MYSLKEPNAGGVNGIGLQSVDSKSEDFKLLQEAILEHSRNRPDSDLRNDNILSVQLRIASYMRQDQHEEITSAGRFLRDFVEAAGISKKRFAEYIGANYSNMIATLNGRRRVNAELALKLEQIFGIRATIWMQLEAKNEILRFSKAVSGVDNYSLGELVQ